MDYKKLLVGKDIAPSLQRIRILEYLHNFKTHPTADMIYKALIESIPTLSKTTVYNTLKTFVEKGLLSELSLFENEIRYEYNTDSHIHFKCTQCGKIYDIFGDYENYENQEIDGHKVTDQHTYLKGICKSCRGNEE